ncbi:hypothetical protein Tco_0399737 [Tanacetum coccineum]
MQGCLYSIFHQEAHYQNKDKKNKLMLIDELYKFSDGTLDDVRTALNNCLKGLGWNIYQRQYGDRVIGNEQKL